MNDEQNIWREALTLLQDLDRHWDESQSRADRIDACQQWMKKQKKLPRLAGLARLLHEAMNRSQFWSVMVPVERAVTRLRVTDVDILDSDMPAEVSQGELMPVKVVVDSMRSAFNLGGILRSSECFGLAEVILCGYTPLPGQPRVAKAALGADELVSWRYSEKIRGVIAELTENGITCYALETVEGAPSIDRVKWKFPCALILGNERFGLDPDVIEMCNGGPVRIQLFGAKNSLNVVSAFSVAAYQVRNSFSGRQLAACRNSGMIR
ncbi:MAG: TrmH family RNA methyltransferase [Kiritimatiellia bacterium]